MSWSSRLVAIALVLVAAGHGARCFPAGLKRRIIETPDGELDERDSEGWEEWEEVWPKEEPKTNKTQGVQSVQLVSLATGLFVHVSDNTLKNDGDQTDPTAVFTAVSDRDGTTLMTAKRQFLGITSNGVIVLDIKNSSSVYHKFRVVEVWNGYQQLCVKAGGANCCLAFSHNEAPVKNTCQVDGSAAIHDQLLFNLLYL